MTPSLRILIGSVLAAGLWFIAASASAGVPDLPKDSYKKAAAADLAFLKMRLAELAPKDKVLDGQLKPALGAAMLLAAYADVIDDPTLKAEALKVAEALTKKDIKGGLEIAKKMTIKPGAGGKAGGDMPKLAKYELTEIMSPYRGKSVGGYNIDRDIKDMVKTMNPTKIDPAELEVLAVRTAVISEYAIHFPNDKASVKADNKAKWVKWSKESVDLSKQIAAEASKGAKADEKKLRMLLTNLNARCTDCHNAFRDDE